MDKNTIVTQITTWIKSKQEILEEVLCNTGDKYVKDFQLSSNSNFLYDLKQCEIESLNLSRSKDLCYDRPSIGLSYAMWYLGRRVNTSLSYIIDLYAENVIYKKTCLNLFDLGAGTGAVQIALGLCQAAAIDLKMISYPQIRIVNIDTSPFMLEYNRSYLWDEFKKKFHVTGIDPTFEMNSWVNNTSVNFTSPIIVTSYLFDSSENINTAKKYFASIINKNKPSNIILLTSYNKKSVLNTVTDELTTLGYGKMNLTYNSTFSGGMRMLKNWRTTFNEKSNENIFSNYTPSWEERSFYAQRLLIKSAETGDLFESFNIDINSLNLYSNPLKIRRSIKLNTQQKDAAKSNNSPTIITGPAGCGKSVVITERIKNLCEELNYEESISILLTTFNKSLLKYLGNWLEDILDNRFTRRQGNRFYFKENSSPNITIYNFDVLPTTLKITYKTNTLIFDYEIKRYITKAVNEICSDITVDYKDYSNILDEDFLLDEYVRVIYGQQHDTFMDYLQGERTGRPYSLGKQVNNKFRRELIWKVVTKFLLLLEDDKKDTIHTRRHKLLKQLRKNILTGAKYSHIFVDEFQDCTQADYQIFYGLLKNNNNLVIAGDFAQAVHLGNSASIPREDEVFRGKQKMKNFASKKLEGSYRLPFRVSECIKPLSEKIKIGNIASDIITPYKGSPPGARPIIVYGNNTNEITSKILRLIWYYQPFSVISKEGIAILEKDKELEKLLNQNKGNINFTTDTILRLKGLERQCIIWSTRAKIQDEEEIYNFVYTILTRTSSILIIALFPDTPEYVWDILKMFDEDKLILWDEASKRIFSANV